MNSGEATFEPVDEGAAAARVGWVAADTRELQYATLRRVDDGWLLETVVQTTASGETRIEVEADAGWRTRRLRITVDGEDRILLTADGEGSWFDAQGREETMLRGVIDPDVSITPLTNTLPIRRLDLSVGDAADIVTAYVDMETMSLSANPQRYTRLSERRWLYESRDSEFRREIDVDEDGLVLDYPGLFRRL